MFTRCWKLLELQLVSTCHAHFEIALRIKKKNNIVYKILNGEIFWKDIVTYVKLDIVTQKNFIVEKKKSVSIWKATASSLSWLRITFQGFIYQSCLFWVKCRFGQMSVPPYFPAVCPFGDNSIRTDVFRPIFHSVICLSVICPFSRMSFGHMSFRSYVFRPNVRTVICLSAICPTTIGDNNLSCHFGLVWFGYQEKYSGTSYKTPRHSTTHRLIWGKDKF